MKKEILGILLIVLICTMILAGCDNGSTNALTAEQQEIKSELLADWAGMPADMKSVYGNGYRIVGLPANLQSWSNSNWIKYFGLSEQDLELFMFVTEITIIWNLEGAEREMLVELMNHLKGPPHDISSDISNNPNDWTKAQAETVFAAWSGL